MGSFTKAVLKHGLPGSWRSDSVIGWARNQLPLDTGEVFVQANGDWTMESLLRNWSRDFIRYLFHTVSPVTFRADSPLFFVTRFSLSGQDVFLYLTLSLLFNRLLSTNFTDFRFSTWGLRGGVSPVTASESANNVLGDVQVSHNRISTIQFVFLSHSRSSRAATSSKVSSPTTNTI